MAQRLQLHQDFGLAPSIQILVEDILAQKAHHQHYIQRPIQQGLEQFPVFYEQYPGFLINFDAPQPVMVDPYWGNNWEASSSSANQVLSVQGSAAVQETMAAPPLLLTWHDQIAQAAHPDPPMTDGEQATQQKMAKQHNGAEVDINTAVPTFVSTGLDNLSQATVSVPAEMVSQALNVQPEARQDTAVKQALKREPQKKPTPIVDDGLRRSTRINKSRLSESKSKDFIFYALPEKKRAKKQTSAPVPEPHNSKIV